MNTKVAYELYFSKLYIKIKTVFKAKLKQPPQMI